MTDDLVAFLQACLDEDEQAARAATHFHPTPWRLDPEVQTTMETGRWVADAAGEGVLVANGDAPAKHFARHDPARVLADVQAKRAVLALFDTLAHPVDVDTNPPSPYEVGKAAGLAMAVRLLASAFADRPNFRQEWAT